MIVNLIGPPGAGKSTFASRFVLEHPEFKYCPIDEYRIKYKNEEQAWNSLLQDLVENKDSVIETSGLSWRFENIWKNKIIQNQPLLTILFIADTQILLERIKTRKKRSIPLPAWLSRSKEPEAIRYFYENKHKCITPADLEIFTDEGTSLSQQYRNIVNRINQVRLQTLNNQ
jgi:shikimate kinase